MKTPLSLRVGDRELLLTNWSKIKGIARETLYGRLKAGWTPEQIVGEELRPQRERKPRKSKAKNPQGPKRRENKLTEPIELRLELKTVVVTDHEATGRAAKKIRSLAGLSMEQAHKTIGWTLSQLWGMEAGRTSWKQKHIDQFNKAVKGWVANDSELHDVQTSHE